MVLRNKDQESSARDKRPDNLNLVTIGVYYMSHNLQILAWFPSPHINQYKYTIESVAVDRGLGSKGLVLKLPPPPPPPPPHTHTHTHCQASKLQLLAITLLPSLLR